jgi:hypothetical protein
MSHKKKSIEYRCYFFVHDGRLAIQANDLIQPGNQFTTKVEKHAGFEYTTTTSTKAIAGCLGWNKLLCGALWNSFTFIF